MKRITMRVLSLLLCLVLCFALIPAPTAGAVQEITSAYTDGIDLPEAGKQPDYTATILGTGQTQFEIENYTSGPWNKGVCWRDITNDTYLTPTDKFVEGHDYELSIRIAAKAGFAFSTPVSDLYVVINSSSGSYASRRPDSITGNSSAIVATVTYGCEPLITSIDLSIDEPEPGEHPDMLPYTDSAFYSPFDVLGEWVDQYVGWDDLTDGVYDLDEEDDVFQEGHKYRATFCVKAAKGYRFPIDRTEVTATVNGKPAVPVGLRGGIHNQYMIEISFDLSSSEAKDGWQKIDGKWYYYENGAAVTGWKQVSGKWYWFDSTGVMQTGWQKISSKWYYFNSSGAMVTGWQTIGGKSYYFQSGGAMVTGVQQIGGKWYYFESSGAQYKTGGWKQISSKWYYFDSAGVAQTGWKQISGKWYWFDSSAKMVTGWQKISGKWYYFNNSGVMQTGWQTISGKTYYFQSGGAMVTGMQQIGGKWYYFESSGAQYKTGGWKQISGKWYYFDSAGVAKVGWLKESGKWYWFNASAQMVTGWQKIDGKWYWFSSGGVMFANGDKTIGGKTYHFDKNGVCTNP